MRHTYLFEDREWEAIGTYLDQKGTTLTLAGKVHCFHNPDSWTLNGYMKVAAKKPYVLKQEYTITEAIQNDILKWEATNSDLGTLTGTFSIVENTILSNYCSPDGSIQGQEVFIQTELYTYKNYGVCYKAGKKLFSLSALFQAKNL